MVRGMSPRIVVSALAVAAVAALSAGAVAGAAAPGATAEKVSCAAEKKAVAKTKGAKRTAAKRQLKRCTDVNTANKRTLALVKGSHFVAASATKQEDWTFCANGKYATATTSEGSTGRSTGTQWRTADATYKSAGTFTVIIEDPKEGLSVGVARKGGKWMIGVSRSFGEIEDLIPATRTAATDC
jgi:hypothetical protein